VSRGVNGVLTGCAFVVAVLTQNPDPDPDLGWHVAGGLFMLETWRLPTIDPFGAQGNFWLCYSWLAEVVFALAYRLGGVAGLGVLEALLRVAVTASIVWCVQHRARREASDNAPLRRTSEWLAIAAAMALVLPLTRLRPQVIGWILFAVLLVCTDRDRLRLRHLAPLTIVWANVHVFWVFVPVIVLFHGFLWPSDPSLRSRLRGAGLAAVCAALGVVNPYGWRMFAALWDLVFDQGAANALALEMSPISAYEGFWLYCAVLVMVAACVRRVVASERRANLATFVLFAALAAMHIRYLPLFALAAVPLLASSVFPTLVRTALDLLAGFVAVPVLDRTIDGGRQPARDVLALGAAVWILSIPLVARSASLPDPHRELFAIAQRLTVDPDLGRARRVHVLSDANFGGWLELAFWLARPPGAAESSFKAAMDNRGLVVGQERFREYDQLRQMAGDWERILARWGVDVAILPSRAAIIQAMTDGTPGSPSADGETWQPIYTSAMWTVLVRHPTR